MPGLVVAALKAHRTRQLKERLAAGGDWQDTALVFTTPIGTALDSRNSVRASKAILKVPGCRISASTISGIPARRCCSRRASTRALFRRYSGIPRSR
jgi:hypothetical protein